MPTRLLLILGLALSVAACGPDPGEPAEELPLPAGDPVSRGVIEGRIGGAAAPVDGQVCAFPVAGGTASCTASDDGRYALELRAGRYHVLAYTEDGVAAHTVSTTCLRDGGVDCRDGRLLEVEVVADSVQPAVDLLDFDNRQPEWPARPQE